MSRWKLCFVLVLPMTFCINDKAILVKTTGKEPFLTPICSNKTEPNDTNTIITLIVCKISTERSRGKTCRLLYEYKRGFEHGCGTRFQLRTENQTVFLHLTSLTPEDSGNYTCECSHLDGTKILHLNISVEEDEDISNSTAKPYSFAVAGVTYFFFITGGILGYVYKKNLHGVQFTQKKKNIQKRVFLQEPRDNTFIQRENELYTAHHTSLELT
ncbi:hypothetical protein EXN66_Car004160 [Channa argus]|uniref:Ig-like domain-containing protein n=1 Tax=Channa argus TaxID=215402 RepID=A0A6G1PEP6_CHAAH|nr:hypothetical protein EXN66_Car004160 [Channa argus]